MYPMQKQGFYPDIIFEVFHFLTRFQLACMEPISYFLHKMIMLHFKTKPYHVLKRVNCTYVLLHCIHIILSSDFFRILFLDTYDGKMYLDRIYLTIKQLEEFPPAFIRFNKLEMEYFYTQMPPLQMPPLYMLNLPMLLQKKNNYVGSNLKLHTLHQLSTVELYQYLDQLINGAFCQCSSISIRTIAIDEGCGKI